MLYSQPRSLPPTEVDPREPGPSIKPHAFLNAVFSDDEEEYGDYDQGIGSARYSALPSIMSMTQGTEKTNSGNFSGGNSGGYVDPLINSSSYHIHLAESALATMKHLMIDSSWKKVLRHKSGVFVYMKKDKTPIFKGEAVIQGFSPQSVFYVVGMRKLWDEQYEDGNLIENLNETTSLTYEVTKPSATSKPRDFALVERIECAPDGTILFVSTSVETPRMPRIQGRVRAQIKLQGWVLEPVRGPTPATRVTYVIQENMKGWVPGLAKKTLARRPLVIGLVNDYLQRKADRTRTQSKASGPGSSSTSLHRQSALSSSYPANEPIVGMASTSSSSLRPVSSKTSSHGKRPILVLPNENNSTSRQRRITFAEHAYSYPNSDTAESPIDADFYLSGTSRQSSLNHGIITPPITPSSKQYPAHRHVSKKVACIQLLKQLTAPLNTDNSWTLCNELQDITVYAHVDGQYIRGECILPGSWSPEQICSLVQCLGARKQWDDTFDYGRVVERFSPKDNLVHWVLRHGWDASVITAIDADTTSGTVYTASTSVEDARLPPSRDPPLERSKIELYGWAFQSCSGKEPSQGIRMTLICQREELVNSLDGIRRYLCQNGYPPYIRRVTGKVIQETFDAQINAYQITYVAKHEPSNAYKARKKSSLQWFTDIRFSHSMYPRGLHVSVLPAVGTHVEILPEQEHVRIYIDNHDLNGQAVTVELTRSTTKTGPRRYTCNGVAIEPTPSSPLPSPVDPAQPAPLTHPLHPLRAPASTMEASDFVSTPSLNSSPSIGPTDQSPRTSGQVSTPISPPPTPTSTPLQIPKGYVLVPQHQMNNKQHVLIISDDLSFNGQQLAVIFIAMMLCYCMGKLAGTSCTAYKMIKP